MDVTAHGSKVPTDRPLIRGEIIFVGIAHVHTHATKEENGPQAGRLCHILKGGVQSLSGPSRVRCIQISPSADTNHHPPRL
jgi:hypothetical protein